MLPKTGVAPPIREWPPEEIAVDISHHLVYAAATGAVYDALFAEHRSITRAS